MKIVKSNVFEVQKNIYDHILEHPLFMIVCTFTGIFVCAWIYSKIPLLLFYYDHP